MFSDQHGQLFEIPAGMRTHSYKINPADHLVFLKRFQNGGLTKRISLRCLAEIKKMSQDLDKG